MFTCSVINEKTVFVGEGTIYALIKRAVNNVFVGEANIEIKLYKKTVGYWKSQPEFSYTIKDMGDTMILEVGTDDKVYKFIDKGTSVRRALMSSDFSPKTAVRRIGNTRGSGRRVAIDKRFNFPGIQAREFSQVIFEKRRHQFGENLKRYIVPYAMQLLSGKTGAPPNKYWR